MGGGKDFFAGYGVHTFGVQVPIAELAAKNGTIGVWASVDRRKVTTRGATTRDAGGWVQVNRLGNPLVNEVIIPTGLKDRWNALQPWSESEFRKYYDEPILAAVINKLYKLGAPETGRDDLVAVLLTGVPKLNYTGPKLADVLRLNLTIPVAKSPNRLGVLGGDTQGWPNGRRLGDDVIDIAEQAVGGFLKDVKLPLGDGVNADDVDSCSTRSPTPPTRSPGSTTRRASRSPDRPAVSAGPRTRRPAGTEPFAGFRRTTSGHAQKTPSIPPRPYDGSSRHRRGRRRARRRQPLRRRARRASPGRGAGERLAAARARRGAPARRDRRGRQRASSVRCVSTRATRAASGSSASPTSFAGARRAIPRSCPSRRARSGGRSKRGHGTRPRRSGSATSP